MLASYCWFLIFNWFLLTHVGVFCFPIEQRNDLICPSVTFCKCSTGTNYEIACPNRINASITLRVEPQQQQTYRVEIECNSDDSEIFNKLPEWNIGITDVVKFNGCPISTSTSVQRVFKRLGIRNVRNLIFFVKNNSNNIASATSTAAAAATITSKTSPPANDILPQQLFENVSNVLSLDLRSNHMRLPSQIFQNLSKLEFLQISSTDFNSSTDSVFRHLNHLKQLNLWNNNLWNVSKDLFADALSLTDLEISSNDIGVLRANVFEHLVSVESINLNSNRVLALHHRLFRTNKALKVVRISSNHIKSNILPNELFAYLPQLEAVWLNDSNFTILPNDLFAESTNLRNISLARNNFREIPATIFHHQMHLVNLDLSYNDIVSLDNRLFNGTRRLNVLHLSYNRLSNISRHLISGLSDLQELYLDNNNLHTIHMAAFDGTNLRVLHLQNNFLAFQNIEDGSLDVEKVSPFHHLHQLQILNIRNNSMKSFLNDWNIENVALQQLDLSYNQIDMINFGNIFNIWMEAITINVTHNRITRLSMAKEFAINENQSTVTWVLNHNPLKCDCLAIHFANQLKNQIENVRNYSTQFITNELECFAPDQFKGQRLESVPLAELTCPLDKENAKEKRCPERCSCYVRTVDSTAVFNCSNADFNEVPALPDIKSLGLQFYDLHIENNNISTLPLANTVGYKNVNRIFAKNNSIEMILAENLPNDLIALDLSDNMFERINASVLIKLHHMINLQNVSLSRNPWICDCAAYELLKFIEMHFTKIVGIDEITCNNNKSMKLIRANGLCPIEQTTILVLCTLIAIIIALILLLTTLYYKHRQEFLVWTFAHHKFARFFHHKPKLDDRKKYDVFILCSTLDEEFVMANLIPKLESESNGFKVCTLWQEIKAGDIVPDQIANCVDTSRRTIVFLTPNFIDCFSNLNDQTTKAFSKDIDIWNLMGFRVAHKNALDEKRTRVIIITKGDIGRIDHFQSELKAYLKTNIYFQWGEKRFFDKLKLAIAHPKIFTTNHSGHIDQI